LLGFAPDVFYNQFMNMRGEEANTAKIIASIKDVTNTTASTIAVAEEDVEDIRQTAPDYYKIGNRLVSKFDFEYYVKNRYKENIIDVKC